MKVNAQTTTDGVFGRAIKLSPATFSFLLTLSLMLASIAEHSDAGAHELIPFTRISVQEGLSQAAVHAIAQDRFGYMWFGTQEGLNRFDGYRFTRFLHRPDDPNSLSHNWVFSLLADRDGFLWIGTKEGGLNRLDPETFEFKHFRHNPKDPGSLIHDRVQTLFQDSKGRVWVGTDGGLSRYDSATGSFTSYGLREASQQRNGDNAVRSLSEAPNGSILIGTDGGGLAVLDPDTGEIARYRSDPTDPRSLSDPRVSDVYVDSEGRVWVGTYHGHIDRFDLRTGFFERSELPVKGIVRGMRQSASGAMWVGDDAGLGALYPGGGEFHRYQHIPNDPYSLSDDRVLSLFEDRGGV